MAIIKEIFLSCDANKFVGGEGCDNNYGVDDRAYNDENTIRKEAKDNGWYRINIGGNKYDLCPECGIKYKANQQEQ